MALSGGAAEQSGEALRQIVDRIKSVVEDEQELLASSSVDGFDRIVARKDQLAIELSRYVKLIGTQSVGEETRQLLGEAAQALGSNAELLRRHIEAVSDVAGIICDILLNANSDGTYTSNAAVRGARL